MYAPLPRTAGGCLHLASACSCGNVCIAAQVCGDGECICDGFTMDLCGDTCVDMRTDGNNCGGCLLRSDLHRHSVQLVRVTCAPSAPRNVSPQATNVYLCLWAAHQYSTSAEWQFILARMEEREPRYRRAQCPPVVDTDRQVTFDASQPLDKCLVPRTSRLGSVVTQLCCSAR